MLSRSSLLLKSRLSYTISSKLFKTSNILNRSLVNRSFSSVTKHDTSSLDHHSDHPSSEHHGEHHEEDHQLSRSDITDRVLELFSKYPKTSNIKNINLFDSWSNIGLDSFDSVEFIMATEEEFIIEIPHDVATSFNTPYDLITYYASHPMAI